MKLCDLTQFYSPVSGGVKRYLAVKRQYLETQGTAEDEHVLVIPGERDTCEEHGRARVYTVASPLLSRTSQYRLLLRLGALEAVLERERPSLIECGDPYQVAWKAVQIGQTLHIPVVGFYHSHFPEAYLRPVRRFLGESVTGGLMEISRRYVCSLYNRFARTIVPSPALGALLENWGVKNVFQTDLGVDPAHFHAQVEPGALRKELGVPDGRTLLLYVGRLAYEKNTQTLFAAFRGLAQTRPDLHLLVIGDGLQRPELEQLRRDTGAVTWLPYCGDAAWLARCYRAADLFVHPGVQETFGLVSVEAQACGTRVVGIRGSYMDRIIHSGLEKWANENSPEALAAAIVATLESLPALSTKQLSACIAGRYSWTEVFHRLFDLYRQVIAEYRPL